jgi:hypothetical protein
VVKAFWSAWFLVIALSVGCVQTDRERAVEAGGKLLTRAEADKALPGNTLVGVLPQYSLEFAVFYTPDGKLVGKLAGASSDRARGQWEITADGQICNRWDKEAWNNGPRCNPYMKVGEELQVFNATGALMSRSRIEPGNPRKLELRSDLELANARGELSPLPGDALRQRLEGNTLSGQLPALNEANYHVLYAPGGKVSASIPGALETDQGHWRIDDTGALCVKWSRWQEGSENCVRFFAKGSEVRVYDQGGSLAVRGKIREGNPEKLKI